MYKYFYISTQMAHTSEQLYKLFTYQNALENQNLLYFDSVDYFFELLKNNNHI